MAHYEKVKVGEKEISYNVKLLMALQEMKKAVKNDWDFPIVIDGMEGGGKSVLAQQVGAYLDPTLNIERICFTAKAFMEAVKKATKYQCVIMDEGFAINSRAAMTTLNRSVTKMMSECRQKNLFIIIVLPSFFDLDKNLALWRTKCLLHVYIGVGFQRGFFKFYDYNKKKNLYVKGKKFYAYNVERPNFPFSRFLKGYYIDENLYREKKLESFNKTCEDDESLPPNQLKDKKLIIDLINFVDKQIPNCNMSIVSRGLGYSDSYLSKIRANYLRKQGFVLEIGATDVPTQSETAGEFKKPWLGKEIIE